MVHSRFSDLLAKKSLQEKRQISVIEVATELDISRHTIYAIAHSKLKQYPTDIMARICDYFGCEIGELLVLDEVQKEPIVEPEPPHGTDVDGNNGR